MWVTCDVKKSNQNLSEEWEFVCEDEKKLNSSQFSDGIFDFNDVKEKVFIAKVKLFIVGNMCLK